MNLALGRSARSHFLAFWRGMRVSGPLPPPRIHSWRQVSTSRRSKRFQTIRTKRLSRNRVESREKGKGSQFGILNLEPFGIAFEAGELEIEMPGELEVSWICSGG
jgi:hypothetical protein